MNNHILTRKPKWHGYISGKKMPKLVPCQIAIEITKKQESWKENDCRINWSGNQNPSSIKSTRIDDFSG